MSSSSTKPIAFNRRLQSSWILEGLRLLAEEEKTEEWISRMEDLVKQTNRGAQSIIKSMRYLRHIWIDPGELDALRRQAVELYQQSPGGKRAVVLGWGMTIASYPFLNEAATSLGRLFRAQPDVKLEQFLRKLTEIYGEKETVRRSGRYALGLLADFEFIQRGATAGRYKLSEPLKVPESQLAGWFMRAWFSASGSPNVIDRVSLIGSPSLAFFKAGELVAFSVESGVLSPERLSFSQEVLRLKE